MPQHVDETCTIGAVTSSVRWRVMAFTVLAISNFLYAPLVDARAARAPNGDVRRPPMIVKGPAKRHIIFRPEENIRLDCVATGIPDSIEYEWFHNGRLLNTNSDRINAINDGHGSIEIQRAAALDEGYYQCHASNQWGTVRSDTVHLRRALLNTGNSAEVRPVSVELGKPFVLEISPPAIYPMPPTFEWETALDTVDKAPTRLIPNRRMQIDEYGNLHFAYATREDALMDGKIYKCVVVNPYLDIRSGGHYTRVTVQGAGNPQALSPQLAFSTLSPKVVVQGTDASLRCFFSGNPVPTITWKRDGRAVQGARYQLANFDSELIIKNVEPSDEGVYTCSVANSDPRRPVEARIMVEVQAIPEFRHPNAIPRDLNATEGDSITWNCDVRAEPDATVVWIQNGRELDPHRPPQKFRFSNNNRNLTIMNLCKNCGDEKSDLQVIQCNVSNVHGYAFATGYVNVLTKTEVFDKDQVVDESIGSKDKGRFVFECRAMSDDSTPVSIAWYHVDERNGDLIQVHNHTDRIIIGRDGSLTIQLPANDSEGWEVYSGAYRCRAGNGYSYDEKTFRITATKPVTPVGTAEPLVEASILDLWWIFVIIAVLLLFFIIILCCCFCYQRNKGDTYPVDEKERENGNNPEKELIDSGFHNYHRPSEDPSKGSQASLADSWPKLNHDAIDPDQCSLDEYGDPEIGKFTEDGSFVGAYTATNDRKNRGRNGSQGNY